MAEMIDVLSFYGREIFLQTARAIPEGDEDGGWQVFNGVAVRLRPNASLPSKAMVEGWVASYDADKAAADAAPAIKAAAQAALDKSDQTVTRCAEYGVPVPEEWRTYRENLRAIVRGGPGPLPARPDYPAGT